MQQKAWDFVAAIIFFAVHPNILQHALCVALRWCRLQYWPLQKLHTFQWSLPSTRVTYPGGI